MYFPSGSPVFPIPVFCADSGKFPGFMSLDSSLPSTSSSISPARTASGFLRGFALQYFCKFCNLKFKKLHHSKFHIMEPDQGCHFPLFHIAETVVDALTNCFRPEGSLPHRVCGCRSDWHLLRLLEHQQAPAAVISFAFPNRPGLTPCRPGAPPLLSSCMAETHGSFFRDSQLPGYRRMPVAFSRPIPKVLYRLSQAVIDASSSVPLCSRSPRMGVTADKKPTVCAD